MSWQITHKCNILDREPQPYAMVAARMHETGLEITRAHCQNCGEELDFLGHDVFKEARSTVGSGMRVPPGLILPQSRRQ